MDWTANLENPHVSTHGRANMHVHTWTDAGIALSLDVGLCLMHALVAIVKIQV